MLHNFTNGADGSHPTRIVIGKDGTIYGATNCGKCIGSNSTDCGTIYSYAPSTGLFTVLHTFGEGVGPNHGVGGIGPDGTVFGSTVTGGTANLGTLFALAPSVQGHVTFTTIYNFTGEADGSRPYEPPAVTRTGELIGTATGDIQTAPASVLYSFSKRVLTNLFTFEGVPTGSAPTNVAYTPTLGANGTVYGASVSGGPYAPCLNSAGGTITVNSCGTVFEYTP